MARTAMETVAATQVHPGTRARMERIRAALRERACGVEINTADVARRALDRGLAALEQELGLVADATPGGPTA